MIVIAASCLRTITAAAEAAFPHECCGLLVGRGDALRRLTVRHVVESPNVAPGGGLDRFEVDPRIRFDLMRALGDGPDRLVGHYHSHPGGPARPSATDLEMAFEPDLVWLITAVAAGRATRTAAHVFDPALGAFREVALRSTRA